MRLDSTPDERHFCGGKSVTSNGHLYRGVQKTVAPELDHLNRDACTGVHLIRDATQQESLIRGTPQQGVQPERSAISEVDFDRKPSCLVFLL